MPKTKIILYRDDDGTVPLRDWFDQLPVKAAAKCTEHIGFLGEWGHELRRPKADYLRDDIYELRIGLQGVNYRLLYFFHGNVAAVVSHGLTKERAVPPREIELAIKRRARFLADPKKHTFKEE